MSRQQQIAIWRVGRPIRTLSRQSHRDRRPAAGGGAYSSPVRRAALLLLPITLTLAACNSGDRDSANEATVPGGADPTEVEVIANWAETLGSGDVEAAAKFFAIPSVAENGPVLIEIRDLDDARLFNASLPCGADLLRARTEGQFTVATFRLTERPGSGVCGDGTGGEATTAFVIENGEIVEWRRVADGERAPSSEV